MIKTNKNFEDTNERNAEAILNKKKDPTRTVKKIIVPEKKTGIEKWYKGIKCEFGDLLQYYKIVKEISRGAYGVVYKGLMLTENKEPSNFKVAIKALFPHVHHQLILTELNYLKLLNGIENFIQLVDFRLANNQFYLITEYFKHTHFEKKFMYSASMTEIKYYMYSLLTAVSKLHELGIIHRDIKQGNFLYNRDLKKGIIIDFGLAEISDEMKQIINSSPNPIKRHGIYENLILKQSYLGENKIGTEGFMPLEQVLKADKQTYSVDVWSCGVILLEFLTSKHTIFKNLKLKKDKLNGELLEYALGFLYQLASIFGTEQVKKHAKLYDFELVLPENLSKDPINFRDIMNHPEIDEDAIDLVAKMVVINPCDRISAKDALNHSFFDSIRKSN